MSQAFDICIRGAGIVGRTLALLLARERLHVALVPQAAPAPSAALATAHSDVRAYALNTASRNILTALRCWPDPADATPVTAMQVYGDDGGEVRFDATDPREAALAWIVDVPALERRLAEAVRYQPAIEVLDAPVPAGLTVVCEGKASSTRAELGVEFETIAYAQNAIATRLVCEHKHEQIARQWFLHGETLAFLPLGGEDGNSVAVVWSVSQATLAERTALDAAGLAEALEHASHGSLGRLQVSGPRAAWPLQLAEAVRFVGTRAVEGGKNEAWALAGDAAHTVHPLAGQGLNLGLGDASELARVLRERESWRRVGDERLLRRYERSRKAALFALRTATDGLQQLFARDDPAWQGLRNWGMKGFDASGPLKSWVARRAMGINS
jgi:2-polyprenyl-6-methoxyphenol hydroxylase-like FAD-dependent oxidoreductase